MSFINVSPFHEFLSGMNFILQINVGVVKLTGETGTGKTALLQELVRGTHQAQQNIVALFCAPASFQQIKDTIRQQLGLDPAVNFHDALLVYLLARPCELRRLIVVFDDADCLDTETLLGIGHLRSIQHAGHNLIGIVLCGKPELNRILRNPEHRLLANDILLSYELSPLSSQQLPDFCRACLAARGLDSFVLVADDYLQIMQKSGGLPGKVAEIVETYWPDDTDSTELPGKIITNNLFAFKTGESPRELSPAPGQETTAAEAKPEGYLQPATQDASFELTAVIAPDVACENAAGAGTEVPAGKSTEALADISGDSSADVSTDVAAEVSSSLPSNVLRDGPCGISLNFSYGIAYDMGTDAPPDAVTEAPAALLAGSAPADGSPADSSPADSSPADFTDATSNSATDLSSVKATDNSSGMTFNAATADLSEESAAAHPVAPAHVSSALAGRHRIIIGSLVAASVVIAIVMAFVPGPDLGIAQQVADAAGEAAPPTRRPDVTTIPTVSVQQFGNAQAVADTANPITQLSTDTAPATEVVAQPLGTETPAYASRNAAASTTAPPPAAVVNGSQEPLAVPASPTSAAAVAAVAQAVVTAWTNAWQGQDVAAYLAFYHPDFVPPNQASVESWQNSRRRTISSQSSISITVEDFSVVNNSGNQTTVQFLLTYRGDTYADRTVKQLVLQPDASGELHILQEQNLQTEVFDPVIEDASSWMRDRTPGELNAVKARNREFVASQPSADDTSLAASVNSGNSEPTESQLRPDDIIMLAASASEIPTSKKRTAADIFVTAPASKSQAPGTIPLIFNLTTLSAQEVQQINDFLMQWAQAWQSQDTGLYFTHYHPDYKAPESATITAWQEERIGKITTPARISISLNELEILENNDNNILIELLMEYHADGYADRTSKRMLVTRSAAAGWLITMERNLEVAPL